MVTRPGWLAAALRRLSPGRSWSRRVLAAGGSGECRPDRVGQDRDRPARAPRPHREHRGRGGPAADAALGVPELDADPAWRLAAAFLVGFRGHTRRAYFNDIRAWYGWCAEVGLHPLEAQRHHVDRWIAELSELPQPKTGKPAAASTITRRLSCLSGLYEYAVVDAGLLDASPVVRVKRPKVSDHSTTVGLDEQELVNLLEAADADGLRSAALITLLALNGLRIDEALSRDANT